MHLSLWTCVKTTEENPEDNCDFYNKAHLRQMARLKKVPIIRLEAQHDNIDQNDGMTMHEENFNGLPAELEMQKTRE